MKREYEEVVVIFISEEKIKKYGYINNTAFSWPVLCYIDSNDVFIKKGKTSSEYVPYYMIEKIVHQPEARDLYPELFL